MTRVADCTLPLHGALPISDRFRETACPEGRQLRDSIYARVLPVPCHHAATIDTPAHRRGTEPEPHGCDGTTVPTVPDSRTVAWEDRFSAVLGRAEPIPTSASLPTASTHTSASTQAQWLQATVRRGLRAPIRDGASLASQGVVASLIGKRLRLNTGSFSVA